MRNSINLLQGDCIDRLKELPDNSISSIVCDPPYGLSDHGEKEIVQCMQAWLAGEEYKTSKKGFMGKSWDSFVPGPEVWKECFRVLKPGGYILAFASTRTDDLMSMAMRLAGFRKHPFIGWVFSTGFPKSTNLYKRFQDEDVWKNLKNSMLASIKLMAASNNVNIAGMLSQNTQIEVGPHTQKNDSVQGVVWAAQNHKNSIAAVVIAELSFCGHHPTNEMVTSSVLGNANPSMGPLKLNVNNVERNSGDGKVWREGNDHFVPVNVPQLHLERIIAKIKDVEALKTWSGSEPYSKRVVIDALCVELIGDLKRTILSQSETFLNCDTNCQTECVSAMIVTITESMVEHLISSTVDTARNEIYNQWDGWYYGLQSLKPAIEPCLMFQKPHEGRMTDNVERYGTGAINVDGCRVMSYDATETARTPSSTENTTSFGKSLEMGGVGSDLGRFPANIILDGSQTVTDLFPDSNGAGGSLPNVKVTGYGDGIGTGDAEYFGGERIPVDSGSGSAARFFKQCKFDEGDFDQIYYCPKASNADRSSGLKGVEDKPSPFGGDRSNGGGLGLSTHKLGGSKKNSHPCVKPTSLMRYLIRLVTPPGGTVLDPFMGSGSTGKAAMLEGFDFVGIELDPAYFEIATARIEHARDFKDCYSDTGKLVKEPKTVIECSALEEFLT